MITKGDVFKTERTVFTPKTLSHHTRQLFYRVDEVISTTAEPQVNGVRVNLKNWADDDPRWKDLKFVDVPLKSLIVKATRIKQDKFGDWITFGRDHLFSADRDADAPRYCTLVKKNTNQG